MGIALSGVWHQTSRNPSRSPPSTPALESKLFLKYNVGTSSIGFGNRYVSTYKCLVIKKAWSEKTQGT